MADTMLTTIDNPYDPYTHFDEWYTYDITKGYDTCGYLARIVKTSDELSETDQELALDQAKQEIISMNILGIYKLVSPSSSEK